MRSIVYTSRSRASPVIAFLFLHFDRVCERLGRHRRPLLVLGEAVRVVVLVVVVVFVVVIVVVIISLIGIRLFYAGKFPALLQILLTRFGFVFGFVRGRVGFSSGRRFF